VFRLTFADTFKALSHPVRREILNLLKAGRLSAGEIAGQFEMTGATISHHLSILKKADLITETREKNFIYYDLNASVLEEIMVWFADLRGSNDEKNQS
jgi:DNA-binding transcriptional ArsR family regulator